METIEVDSEVFAYLQEHAEPLVDTPSTVLRRLLGIGEGNTTAVNRASSRGSPSKRAEGSASGPASNETVVPLRRPTGDLLPIEDYRPAILEFLKRQEGQEAHLRDVLVGVGQILKDQFTATDREELEVGKPYWHTRLPWAGTEARKEGLMATDAPRGVWRLTKQGGEEAAKIERVQR